VRADEEKEIQRRLLDAIDRLLDYLGTPHPGGTPATLDPTLSAAPSAATAPPTHHHIPGASSGQGGGSS